jgi:hypothetical protein
MKRQTPIPIIAVNIAGASEMTSLSQTAIDIAIRAGELRTRHHGNRTLILVRDLEKWVESFPAGRAPAPAHLEGKRRGRPRKDRGIA